MSKQDCDRAGGRGAPRKSRRKRSCSSGTLGAPTKWKPTDDDWRRFEAAYQGSFDEDIRTEIGKIVDKYFYWAAFEPTAPFVDEFIKKLNKAKKLARELVNVTDSFGADRPRIARHWEKYFSRKEEHTADGPHGGDSVAIYEWVIKQPIPRERRRSFSEMVHIIYSALDDTLREVSKDDAPSWEEGNCWKQLVLDLVLSFKSRKLPVTASKDRNKHGASPFVAFVKELQSGFDEEFRRHTSDDALASEISKVLNLLKKHQNMKDK